MASVVVSTPLNYIFFNGYTGNRWGDGVIDLMKDRGFNAVFSYITGEYYVDFIDKVLLLVILFAVVRLYRYIMKRKKGKKITLALSVGVMLCCAVFPAECAKAAQAGLDYSTWLQTIYNNETGLPGGEANDIAQTEDGALWIGTYGGLYRYSGNEFQWMNEFESIKNVNCFYTDDEGRLWIGTNDNGLSICINNEIANVVDEDSGLPSNSVRCIAAGEEGNYYVGTTGDMAVVNLSSGLSVVDVISGITYAKSISVNSGYAAVVSDDGTLFLLEGTEILSKVKLDGQRESFTCCVFSSDGVLSAGTAGNQIVRFTVANGELRERSRVDCGDIMHLNSLNILEEKWIIVCADSGVGYIDTEENFYKINTNQFNSSIDHMLCDYQGSLWFTSSRLGLLKLCETPFAEIYSKLGIEESVVNAITKWRNAYYFGTDGGLDMADHSLSMQLENELTEKLAGVRVRSFLVDSRGELWICTAGEGVWRVPVNGEPVIYASASGALGDKFRSALEMKDGMIVLAGDLGLTFVRDGAIVRTLGSEDGLENPKVLCLFEREDGALLAGTDGNGIALIRDGSVVKTFQKEDGLGSKVIMRMVADPKGEGIFVVSGNSLCFMDNRGKIRILENFPYYNNFDLIVGNDGELFVTCSAGIYVVDRDALLTEENPEYLLLDAGKGLRATLTANSWNYVEEGRYLFLAGDAGVTVLDMENYLSSRRSYRMNIRSIQIDDALYFLRLGEEFSVPVGAKRIDIMPEIVNYSITNPYVSCYLEGFDAAPQIRLLSELGNVVYTNLPSGEYTFHLAVLDDKGGTVSENTYSIIKTADIHDEKWFMFYVGFVFVLTIIYLTWMLFRTQIQKTLNIQRRELALARRQVEMSNEAILTIAKTVDAKDINTSQHSIRVSEYAGLIAERLGFSEEEQGELKRTALLHDIGKIGIPDSVLNKPAKLTDEEYSIMKSHVTKGAEILKGFSSVAHIVEGAQYHHERYDGRGYAEGLKGEEIPLYARIIGIADAFDAMTANRVYRKKLDFDYVLGEIKKGRGTQFDPQMADILLELIADGTIRESDLYKEGGSVNGTGI